MTNLELQSERRRLRQALLVNRVLMEQSIDSVYSSPPPPRSRTMRFLRKNTALARLAGRSLKFMLATRLFR